jgi:hypothetical protein
MTGRWRRTAIAATVAAALTGCHSGGDSTAGSSNQTPGGDPPSTKITVAAADRPACRALYARLQQVTGALDELSQLIANSLDPSQLSQRIASEQRLLEQAARLMAAPPIPAALVPTDRQLVGALRAFAADFSRAAQPAASGDFQTAADAMTDRPAVRRIISASRAIEKACR